MSVSISALLLLVLECPVAVSRALPAVGQEGMRDFCVLNARALLRNITSALTQAELFSGIDCTRQNMEVNLNTDTPSVCSPKDSNCSRSTKSDFDQASCLTNIGNDLTHYYTFLYAQPDPDHVLGSSVLQSLRELMETCFKGSVPTELKKAAADHSSTYSERLNLCKVMRGFHVRTITINRAIGYMNSGDHQR
ncbi:interleukin-12 subunit alpha-like [Nothobranchius furzeri]|uniref:Interleukin-12 subunit alpha n=1 Tax=Nothobranchius furzeri TaxID=105023 RepID=A0A8C6VUE8_NOTFU|nr:interleukin-12 subunit alpha-like [Nothobranchius furzeri]KAF7222609.1 interleukin-12 subunit alpha-like [Nothobranchius furzeri]